MASFIVESNSGTIPDGPVRLVDLGASDYIRSRRFGATRAAWSRWTGSRHLCVMENVGRLLYIEGQPDRLPREGESFEHWFEKRGGSFRGFQIERVPGSDGPWKITAFVDPLGTRPIFLFCTRGRICFADKISTLIANRAGGDCDWGALLEFAALGSLYSDGTSVQKIAMLSPGEVVEIEGSAILSRRTAPLVLDSGARLDPDAGKKLETALRTAIQETWTDPDAVLLLSGGLDSRLIFGLAPERPLRALTFDLYSQETEIARRVAATRRADLRVVPYPPEHYCGVMQNAYLVSAAMHQSRFVNHLGLGLEWRQSGIPALVHGYFHNTVFRGWCAERWRRYPDGDFPLTQYMGRMAHYFDQFSCQDRPVTNAVLELLSPEGKDVLKRRLKTLADSIEPVVVDGIDLTFERLLLKGPSRQVFFGQFHGWLEEIDVVSPVFHPSVWHWYASTHPADRFRSRAVQQVCQTLDYGLADIPDVNTGKRVTLLPEPRREEWRNCFWYPAARAAWRAWRRLSRARYQGPVVTPINWTGIFRQKPITEALCSGIEGARDCPLLSRHAIDRGLAEYMGGGERLATSLWALAIAGQWQQFVATQAEGNPAVHTVETNPGSGDA